MTNYEDEGVLRVALSLHAMSVGLVPTASPERSRAKRDWLYNRVSTWGNRMGRGSSRFDAAVARVAEEAICEWDRWAAK